MIQRTWDISSIAESLPWLRYQNREGRNIYVRPSGEHDLSMVDDLTANGIVAMKQSGFNPAIVVETSSGNFQAWLKHPERLGKDASTAAARALAESSVVIAVQPTGGISDDWLALRTGRPVT